VPLLLCEPKPTKIQQEYTPLDPALVRAILSDYDYTDPVQVQTVREFLDSLRASALAEDDVSFDPSGTSGHDEDAIYSPGRDATGEKSSTESVGSGYGETSSSISNGFSSLSIDSAIHPHSDLKWGSNEVIDGLEKLSTEEKVAQLLEYFPSEKQNNIAFVLRKCDGNFTQALDTLLNHAFFNDDATKPGERVPTKGVDAFAEEHVVARGMHKKGKKKFKGLEEYSPTNVSPVSAGPNKWENANAEIQFIASRTNMADSVISSLYHKNGASKNKTILALIEQNVQAKKKDNAEDISIDVEAINLSEEFPSLTFSRAAALIRLAYPSTSNAHELAKSLLTAVGSSYELDRIVPQYIPIQLSDLSPSPRTASPVTPSFAGNSATLSYVRNDAFAKASTYYRKGKSDHLMGGAAAYYAAIGRDANNAMKSAGSAEADALVASQSSATQMDLHGVSVHDAKRIASERVRTWWHNLNEGRLRGTRSGVGEGFRIVTGLGVHSQGGVAKVGPAVMRMLVKEGWKVEVGSGVLIVTGVVKRK
jgi:hypothetical protein